MAGWHDTIDTMLDLRQFWSSHNGIRYGESMIQSVAAKDPDMARGKQHEPGWLANAALSQIDNAEPFFVAPDVMDMIDHAAATFEPEPLQRTDLIVERGFALLPRPLYTIDRKGKTIATTAFSWGPAEAAPDGLRIGESAPVTGTYLLLYSDMTDLRDGYGAEMRPHFDDMREMFGMTAMKYALWHFSPWWFGTSIPKVEEHAAGRAQDSSPGLWRKLQTFFRLSMQQIVETNYTLPPRPYARRAKRAGRDPGVLVMQLRRRGGGARYDGDGDGPERDFRWLVRGHWRNQWYESLREHRQIWIAPYVKGPEDKPFKAPALRAWTFNR